MAPKVLVSDALSETAVQIFRDRGVEVDYMPDLGKDKDKLAEIIGATVLCGELSLGAAVLAVAHGRQGHATMAELLPDRPVEVNLVENRELLAQAADRRGHPAGVDGRPTGRPPRAEPSGSAVISAGIAMYGTWKKAYALAHTR